VGASKHPLDAGAVMREGLRQTLNGGRRERRAQLIQRSSSTITGAFGWCLSLSRSRKASFICHARVVWHRVMRSQWRSNSARVQSDASFSQW
jgi:hypothetical protein